MRLALSQRLSPGTEQDVSGTHGSAVASPFEQPKAVFAVAFACVVSFMGIGLVDPILPAISKELHASDLEEEALTLGEDSET